MSNNMSVYDLEDRIEKWASEPENKFAEYCEQFLYSQKVTFPWRSGRAFFESEAWLEHTSSSLAYVFHDMAHGGFRVDWDVRYDDFCYHLPHQSSVNLKGWFRVTTNYLSTTSPDKPKEYFIYFPLVPNTTDLFFQGGFHLDRFARTLARIEQGPSEEDPEHVALKYDSTPIYAQDPVDESSAVKTSTSESMDLMRRKLHESMAAWGGIEYTPNGNTSAEPQETEQEPGPEKVERDLDILDLMARSPAISILEAVAKGREFTHRTTDSMVGIEIYIKQDSLDILHHAIQQWRDQEKS